MQAEVWKTVSLGTRDSQPWNAENLRSAVEARGTSVAVNAVGMMNSPVFIQGLLQTTRGEVDLTVVRVEEVVGCGCGSQPLEFFALAVSSGFQTCPYWVGPRLLVDFIPEPNDRFVIGSQPIDGRWFGIGRGHLYSEPRTWLAHHDRIVLVKPRKVLVQPAVEPVAARPVVRSGLRRIIGSILR